MNLGVGPKSGGHEGAKNSLAGWLWISPWIVGFAAFMLLPMAMSLYYSLTDYPMLEKPLWLGLDNYVRMMSDPDVIGAATRTLVYAAISIPLSIFLALVIAAMLASRVRFVGALQSMIFLPTLVPLAASGMVWLWLLNGQYGLINRVLGLFGIPGPNWLGDFAMGSLVLISLWGVGQMVVVFVAAMQEVPESLYEAAELDGMSPARKFASITLPMISPVILFNVITLMIGAVQVFAVPYIIRSATPGGDLKRMEFYTMVMYDQAFVNGQMGYASAMAWVQLVVVLILTGLMFAMSKKLVHYRG